MYIVPDAEVGSVPTFGVTYLRYYGENYALGAHLYGYMTTTDTFTMVDGSGNPFESKFDLDTGNFGLQGRYLFSTGVLKPYGYRALNWATGPSPVRPRFPGSCPAMA